MTNTSPARCHTTNGSSYSAWLKNHGSLHVWLDKDMTWIAPHDGAPGRPAAFSDAAVQFA